MPVVQVGQPAGNLLGSGFAPKGKTGVGILGEERLGKKILEWAKSRTTPDQPILVAFAVSSDGRGDVDAIVASGNTVIMIDAKNFARGYTYGLTPNFQIRRARGTKTPKGRAFAKTGGDINSVSQKERLEKMLIREGVKGFRVAKPLVVLSPAMSGSVAVHRDENWKKAPFALLTIEEIEWALDAILPEEKRFGSARLIRLAEAFDSHKKLG